MEPEVELTREELLLLLSAKSTTITQQSELIEGLVAQVERLVAQNKGLAVQVEALTVQVEALARRQEEDSFNSSKPPSSDPPFTKPAPKRSSRTSSGRRRGKQDGAPGETLKLVDDPDETFTHDPRACHGCGGSLVDAPVFDERGHQVFDAPPPPPRPHVTEYRIVSRTCANCGTTSEGDVPAWARGRVQYGPKLLARAAWLVCAHQLPVRRAASVLATLLGSPVSTGWTAAVRGRAARLLESAFMPRVKELIASAPVAHADETCARADGALRYPHAACTEHLTAMHIADRTIQNIDAGGIWPAFDCVLVRDGYGGYLHLGRAPHAWCGAHYADA